MFVILLDAGVTCVVLLIAPDSLTWSLKLPMSKKQNRRLRKQKHVPRSRVIVSPLPGRTCVSLGGECGAERLSPTRVLIPFSSFRPKMESFILGRHITFWEANPSSPEILPTVL